MFNCNTCKKSIPEDSEFCPFCGSKIIHTMEGISENGTPLHSYKPDALLKRAFLFIEEMRFDKANAYIEEVLNQDPENAEAYLAKLLMAFNAPDIDELSKIGQPFDDNINYKRAFRYGDEALKQKLLDANKANTLAIVIQEEHERILKEQATEAIYQESKQLISNAEGADFDMANQDLEAAKELLSEILGYKDSAALLKECEQMIMYNTACKKMHSGNLYECEEALHIFEKIVDYKDSKEKIEESKKLKESTQSNNTADFTGIIVVAAIFLLILLIICIVPIS